MAKTNGWYDKWWSEDCADGDGYCDGIIPEWDEDAPLAECACSCHREREPFISNEDVAAYHDMNRSPFLY